MSKKLIVLLAAMTFSLATVVVLAEDTKPSDTTKTASATQTAQMKTETSVGFGYQNVGLNGNPSKLDQYLTPAQGFFLDNLTVDGLQRADDGSYFHLSFDQLGEKSWWRANGSFHSVSPIASFNARDSRYQFTFEPTATNIIPNADRITQDYALKWTPLRAIKTIKAYRQIQDVTEPKVEVGKPTIDFTTDKYGVELCGVLNAPGSLGKTPWTLNLSKETFFPRAAMAVPQSQPESHETHAELGWTPIDRDRIGVDLVYLYNKVDQDFVSSPASSHTFRVSALAFPVDGLIGRLTLNRIGLNQPLTANGFSDSYNSSNLDLHYVLGGLSLRGGLDYRNVNHINSDHTGSTNPIQKQFYLQAKERFSKQLTVSARYDDTNLNRAPAALVSVGDPRSLYFDGEQKWDFRADATVWRDVFLYGGYNRIRQTNSARATDNTIETTSFGGYKQLTNKLSITLDYSRQKWSGQIPALATDLNADTNPLARWLPDSRTTTLALSYACNPRTWLSASMTSCRSIGASDPILGGQGTLGVVKNQIYEASVNHTLNEDFSLGFTYRYATYDDNTEPALGYRENRIFVSLKTKM